MKIEKKLNFFRNNLFKGLTEITPEEVWYVSSLFQKKTFRKDNFLYSEFEKPVMCFLIKKGDIEVKKY